MTPALADVEVSERRKYCAKSRCLWSQSVSGPAMLEGYHNVRILATTCASALCHTFTKSCVNALINCCKPAVSTAPCWYRLGHSQDFGVMCISGLAGQNCKEKNCEDQVSGYMLLGSIAEDLWKQHIWVGDCPVQLVCQYLFSGGLLKGPFLKQMVSAVGCIIRDCRVASLPSAPYSFDKVRKCAVWWLKRCSLGLSIACRC